MRIEIREGASSTVGSKTIKLTRMREVSFANHEGKLESRRIAVLDVGGESIEVAEGSLIPVDDGRFKVVRIRLKGHQGFVRLRPSDAGLGRFAAAVDHFHGEIGPFDTGMVFLVQGVRGVDEVISRLDEHPDTVGSFEDPLRRAQAYLQHARGELADAGASADLLAYVDRYIAVCAPLIETILSSTQEREIED
jgi:hypothetical protein